MHVWHQSATSFTTSSYSFDNFNNTSNSNNSEEYLLDLDVLNNSSLNFARPDSSRLSHTAAMTAARRILHSLSQAHEKFPITRAPKPHKYDTEQMKPGVHPVRLNIDLEKKQQQYHQSVSFIVNDVLSKEKILASAKIEPVKELINKQELISKNEEIITSDARENQESILTGEIKQFSQHQTHHQREPIPMLRIPNNNPFRRVSAPSFTYAYFSAPAANSTNNMFFQSSSSRNDNDDLSIDTSNIPPIDTSASTLSSQMTSSSLTSPVNLVFTPSQPLSLSPCSSTSSVSSSSPGSEISTGVKPSITTSTTTAAAATTTTTDHIFLKKQQYPQDINDSQQKTTIISPTTTTTTIETSIVSPMTTRRRSQVQFIIPNTFSAPTISSESYSEIRSPAASWLGYIANITSSTPMPDDEGEQVGEYVLGKVIGRGGFSTVREAYTVDSGSLEEAAILEKVAVKIVKNNPESESNDRLQALLQREIEIWRHLKNPHIVRMISYEETDYATFIFAEFCPGGTLLQYIKKASSEYESGLDEDQAREIFLQIAESVRYLHNDMRLIHKDIKLDNILLDKEGTWKLCDFGLTEYQSGDDDSNNALRDECAGGSLAYCPPEQLRSKTPIKELSVDIWSLAVVLYALVTGQLPYNDDFEPRLQFKILNGRFDESPLRDSNASEDLRELLRGMFKTKPEQRLTINEVIESRWCRP
ncbi:5896_t:CDS:2 [Ambispora gerdemannii]|uniref:5896_t:CDS:1 n=1 Tax=Ambispora gerdemannii TaxID=144530 RepID=A0A9N8W857_9GLOM|nr:5896_t:CDS:2 [Ambispora gerdemannii]